MSFFDDYSDALVQETLVDMAETFFGSRKSIDDEKEVFAERVEQLKLQGQAALARAATLHALLLQDEIVHDFYLRLGVRPGCLLLLVEPERARPFGRTPFAFTAKGRYTKLVLAAYDSVQQAFDEYLNGRYYKDPRQPSRKRLSLHYLLLKQWAGHLNTRIRNVNESLAPSCVLGFVKGLDVSAAEREAVTGATLHNYACSLDESLKMSLVDTTAMGLLELPELPPLEQARQTVRDFAAETYSRHATLARSALRRLGWKRV